MILFLGLELPGGRAEGFCSYGYTFAKPLSPKSYISDTTGSLETNFLLEEKKKSFLAGEIKKICLNQTIVN